MASSSDPPREPVEWVARFETPRSRAWFDRPTRRVARELLGEFLVRRRNDRFEAVRIVETEAYLRSDEASHAYRGVTPRNRSMFGEPGTLYVYRIHQVHCANVVTRRGEAVLLRSAEPLDGMAGTPRGPGRLCRTLGITRSEDGSDLVSGSLRILPSFQARGKILRGPRVGIRRNAAVPWRYGLAANRWVSLPRLAGKERPISAASPS
ncbi:MAG: DNA-3-methyladenine glycosylase [Thermoplasmata archaeon]|nr:DNA-3-methyladenine glycosylase [Thermoplasmata archaeon]